MRDEMLITSGDASLRQRSMPQTFARNRPIRRISRRLLGRFGGRRTIAGLATAKYALDLVGGDEEDARRHVTGKLLRWWSKRGAHCANSESPEIG